MKAKAKKNDKTTEESDSANAPQEPMDVAKEALAGLMDDTSNTVAGKELVARESEPEGKNATKQKENEAKAALFS